MPINLDKIDKRILFELDKNARIPDTKLAKIVGRSKESIRYRIKKLQEEGVIKGFTIWIDPARLGYYAVKIYLQLANKPTQKKAFVDFVKADKRLFWLGIAEGAWNAGLTYFVQSNKEFYDIKNELFSTFKDLILESKISFIIDIHVFDKALFSKTETKWSTAFDCSQHYLLDDLEKHILKTLFHNARTNVVAIALKQKTTVDKVRNRMKKLEDQKIIWRYLALIDYFKLGYEFYKTFLYFKNLTVKDEKRLFEYCKEHSQIIHIVRQIGSWDIELEILCSNHQEYNAIIGSITEAFSEVIHKVETAMINQDVVFPAREMVFE